MVRPGNARPSPPPCWIGCSGPRAAAYAATLIDCPFMMPALAMACRSVDEFDMLAVPPYICGGMFSFETEPAEATVKG